MKTVDYSEMNFKEKIKHQDELIKNLVNILPEKKYKSCELKKFKVSEDDVKRVKLMSSMEGKYGEYLGFEPGEYIKLIVDLELVMSNTWMEIETNRDVMNKANGTVLIAGLGIGMIVLPIQEKKNVDKIIIVESNKDVIKLVGNNLPLNNKVEIINENIFSFQPDKKEKYDVVYCDVWNTIDADNWDGMKKLTAKFKYHMNRDNPECLLTHWRKEDVKKMFYETNSKWW